MPFFLGARRLSQLNIDGTKDWAAKNLANLGELGWGGDVTLNRLAADILGSPDVIRSSPGGYFSGHGGAANHLKLDAYVSGDSYQRFLLYADGGMSWGPGNAPADISLYRESSDILRLTKAFYCADVARFRGTGAEMVGGDAVLEKVSSGGILYIWNLSDGKGFWLDFTGNYVKFQSVNQLVPSSDNAGSVGTDSARWALIRGVTVTGGDLGLENGWAFTEDPVHGVVLKSPRGKRYRLVMEAV